MHFHASSHLFTLFLMPGMSFLSSPPGQVPSSLKSSPLFNYKAFLASLGPNTCLNVSNPGGQNYSFRSPNNSQMGIREAATSVEALWETESGMLEAGKRVRIPEFWEFPKRMSLRCRCGGAWLSLGNWQPAWTTIICRSIMGQALAMVSEQTTKFPLLWSAHKSEGWGGVRTKSKQVNKLVYFRSWE
jgi:hypothetical protein